MARDAIVWSVLIWQTLEKATEIGPRHETNLVNLKKLMKDTSINAVTQNSGNRRY